MKGVRCFLLNGKLLPKGQTGFFYRHKEDWGVKVFYKLDNARCYRQTRGAVMKEWRNRKKLEPYGVIPRSPKIVKVRINVDYNGGHIDTWSYAIKTEFVHYPANILEKFARGYPYDFSLIEHPDHTPKGYLKFCDFLTKKLKKAGVGVCGNYPFKEKKPPKLGDILWDTKKEKWVLVDVA